MKSIFNKILIICFLSILLSPSLFAQLSDEKIKQIDDLFIEWNSPDHPGGSIGVMLDDELVYAKSFGLASLEYLVPNTYGTQYNIASVSKQLTAFGICLLQVQGKLNVDDNIRKYLPYMPEFSQPITIRHMLHHTSGLRSLHTMLALAGWRGDDSRTNEDLVAFLKRQKDLNFVPGAEYMYCNTGYILMSEIIEKISGEEFTVWMDKNVFKPLGMNHTYVERFYDHVVKNNATSYDAIRDGGFNRSVEYWAYVGSGNVHTNVADLLIWLEQLRAPNGKMREALKLMRTTDNFNNGKHNKYAFGVNVDQYKNENRISHGGSIGGFRSNVCTYPDQKLSIVILTNFSSSNPGGKVADITDIILDKKPSEQRTKTYRLSAEKFDQFAGRYKFNSSSKTLDVFRIGNTYYLQEQGLEKLRIEPISEHSFVNGDHVKINFSKEIKSNAVKINYTNQQQFEGNRVKEFISNQKSLEQLSGIYWSPELETRYKLYIEDGKLKGHHSRHGEFNFRQVRDDEYNGSPSYFNFFKVKRDKRGRISGIYVTNSRARNVWFEKSE